GNAHMSSAATLASCHDRCHQSLTSIAPISVGRMHNLHAAAGSDARADTLDARAEFDEATSWSCAAVHRAQPHGEPLSVSALVLKRAATLQPSGWSRAGWRSCGESGLGRHTALRKFN